MKMKISVKSSQSMIKFCLHKKSLGAMRKRNSTTSAIIRWFRKQRIKKTMTIDFMFCDRCGSDEHEWECIEWMVFSASDRWFILNYHLHFVVHADIQQQQHRECSAHLMQSIFGIFFLSNFLFAKVIWWYARLLVVFIFIIVYVVVYTVQQYMAYNHALHGLEE